MQNRSRIPSKALNCPAPIRHFYLLDLLRGLASLSVLVWHYQHFFFLNCKLPQDFDRSDQPGYVILKPLFEHGYLSVYLFFILSGFIFFHIYSQAISVKSVSLKIFVANRFSRLYPLHFLTLLFTAALQFEHHRLFSSYFVYEFNDIKHFLLQLVLASSWGLQDGYSFNGPIWSVSVEVLLYIIFFFFCRFLPLRPRFLLIICLLGLLIGGMQIGAGIFCFFMGGLVNMQFESQQKESVPGFGKIQFPILGLCLTTAAFYPLTFVRSDHLKVIIASATILPAIVYFLACLQIRRPNCGESWRLAGDISYAAYLLHFPLQILIHALFTLYGFFDPASISTLITFPMLTCGLSYLTHRVFELPAKKLLRNWLR